MQMKRSRHRVAAVAVLLGCLVTPVVSSAAVGSIVDEGWIPTLPQGVIGRQAVTLMDKADYMEMASVLRGFPTRGPGYYKSCTSLADPNCQGVEVIELGAILQRCPTPASLNCVAEFGLVRADGSKVPATFERSFPAEAYNKFAADESKSLPVGGPGALWSFPTAEGLTNPMHYVRASIIGKAKPGEKFEYTGFAASINAVSLSTKTCQPTVSWSGAPNPCTPGDYTGGEQNLPGYAGFVENLGTDVEIDCIMTGDPDRTTNLATCALRKNLPLDVSYYLTLRLSQSPQGWLHGRLADADVAIASIADVPGAVTVSMRGKAVRVPVVHKEMAFADLPASLKTIYAPKGSWPSSSGGSGYASNWGLADVDAADGTKRNRNSNPPSYGPDGIAELEAWMPTLNDTSVADRSTWSVRSLSEWERQNANDCFTDKTRVTGLVLTNATQYAAGAPVYNKAAKSLDYKVAAPHYMSNGELFKGSYQLMMRSDVARCIYGFVGDAIKATVSVLESGSGETSTAVTTVAEGDGWLRLSATGYTHSAPTIRAKLIERKASLRVGSTIANVRVAKTAGLTVPTGAKVTLKVPSRYARNCRVRGASVVGTRNGSCAVTVTVTHAGKRSTKTLRIQVG